MDLIRAYACGLLPDCRLAYDDPYTQSTGIWPEVQNYMPYITRGDYIRLCTHFIMSNNTYGLSVSLSARALCQKLLALYEEQGEKI